MPVFVLLVSLLVSPAGAQEAGSDNEARIHFEMGAAAFESGRFFEAVRRFERAYELSGRSQLLFNLGSAADRARLDEKALSAYRRYLAALPEAGNRGYVEERIQILEATLLARDEAEREAQAAAAASAEEAERRAVEAERRAAAAAAGQDGRSKKKRRVALWVTSAVVVVGAGVGLGFALAPGSTTVEAAPLEGSVGGVVTALEAAPAWWVGGSR